MNEATAINAIRDSHPPRLGIAGDPVRKKHDAELTNDGIE